jgi:hypothetical protein
VEGDALAPFVFPLGVGEALGVGVALGLGDGAGAWMHHDDFVTWLVIPFRADSAAARLG